MHLLEEIKKYFIYLSELGIDFFPFNENLNKFLKNNNYLSINNIERIKNSLLTCKKCTLHRIRKQPIWGQGNEEAQLMIISEYPDRDEDFYGRPFAGSSEEILKKMLSAIKLRMEDFFITHAVKCKTPGGRPPESDEILACKSYLLNQIKLLNPKLILAFGFTPPKIFFENNPAFSSIRGNFIKIKDSIVLFTYHPNYIIKNPIVKRLIWEDLQKFRKFYEEIFQNF